MSVYQPTGGKVVSYHRPFCTNVHRIFLLILQSGIKLQPNDICLTTEMLDKTADTGQDIHPLLPSIRWNCCQSWNIWTSFPIIPGDFPGKFDGVYFWSDETRIMEKTLSKYIWKSCNPFRQKMSGIPNNLHTILQVQYIIGITQYYKYVYLKCIQLFHVI